MALMFRVRDMVALCAAVVLSRMAWNTDHLDAVGASVSLAWYLPRGHGGSDEHSELTFVPPRLLDIDGDGAAEALVVVSAQKRIRILDLRQAALAPWTAPLVPPLLIETEVVPVPQDVHAMYLATGHVYMKDDAAERASSTAEQPRQQTVADRTRHYFCGSSWHDAAKCQIHCPSGLSSDCPEGETCYADTPCDAVAQPKEESAQTDPQLDALYTPAGSLPSVATLWENGAVTLHALAISNTTRKIEFSLLWTTNLLAHYTVLNWENEHLEFLDALTADNGHGLILLSGQVDLEYRDGEMPLHTSVVVAIHAKTGEIQWESLSDDPVLHPPPKLPLPLQDDSKSSIARRRSLHLNMDHQKDTRSRENCMHFYRRSILTSGVLPFLYWNHRSAHSQALHFDAQQKLERQYYHAKRKRKVGGGLFQRKRGKHRQRPSFLRLGKPNVIATSNRKGLQLRSLKNGRLLCHLSLWEETLFADFNHDGTLDSASLITGRQRLRDDDEQGHDQRWISELVGRVAKVQSDATAMKEIEQDIGKQAVVEAQLCHLHVLSGLPAKETLFSINVCGPTHLDDVDEDDYVVPAPPLSIEAINGRGVDVVVAVNTGYTTRVHGTSGRIIWQAGKAKLPEFPTWDEDNAAATARVDSKLLEPEYRPVLLIGQNGLAIFSARHGRPLASSLFPQASQEPPTTVDFNGDGTTDVIVQTSEALLGYAIHIQAGSSLVFRVSVGLLMMLIMLALLRNRFGPQPGRRSSDA